MDPADVIGGRRLAAIPTGFARVMEAVDVELVLPMLPALAVRWLAARFEAGRGTVPLDDGFLVVVGTKLDEGFRCDCRRVAVVDTEREFGATFLEGTTGEEGVFRLLTLVDGAKGPTTEPRLGIAVGRAGDAQRGRRDILGTYDEVSMDRECLIYIRIYRTVLAVRHPPNSERFWEERLFI